MPVRPVPEGYHTVTPYLVTTDATKLLDFLERGLGASVGYAMRGPQGEVAHAEVTIGDSRVMVGQGGGMSMPAMLYLYVEDADALYSRALAAGAESVQTMKNQFYGDRSGAVRDPAGNQWWIATHVEDVPEPELERRAAEARSAS